MEELFERFKKSELIDDFDARQVGKRNERQQNDERSHNEHRLVAKTRNKHAADDRSDHHDHIFYGVEITDFAPAPAFFGETRKVHMKRRPVCCDAESLKKESDTQHGKRKPTRYYLHDKGYRVKQHHAHGADDHTYNKANTLKLLCRQNEQGRADGVRNDKPHDEQRKIEREVFKNENWKEEPDNRFSRKTDEAVYGERRKSA